MPSTRSLTVLAVALLVATAGCTLLPNRADDPAESVDVGDAPDHHEFVFAAHTSGTAFDATVTIEAGGETVHTEDVASDGNGTYLHLANVSASGPYTVTVNTTLPGVGGGNRSRRIAVDRGLGNATAVQVSYRGIVAASFQLPRRPLAYPLAANTNAIEGDEDLPMNLTVDVAYRGTPLASGRAQVESGDLERVVELAQTGVYTVTVAGPAETTTELVVVADRQQTVAVRLTADGRIERVHADEPIPWQ